MSEPPPQSLQTLLRLDAERGPATPLDAAALQRQVQQVLERHAAASHGPAAATPTRRRGRVVLWTLAAAALSSAAAAMVLRMPQAPAPGPGAHGVSTPAPIDGVPAAELAALQAPASALQDLLAEANRQRGAANYERALSLYLRVSQSTDDTLSAHVALVAAADLQLEQLHAPQRARVLYERALALRPQGPVAPEAREGLRRALSQLRTQGDRP